MANPTTPLQVPHGRAVPVRVDLNRLHAELAFRSCCRLGPEIEEIFRQRDEERQVAKEEIAVAGLVLQHAHILDRDPADWNYVLMDKYLEIMSGPGTRAERHEAVRKLLDDPTSA